MLVYPFWHLLLRNLPLVFGFPLNERGRTVPEHAFMNEPGQTSGAAAV